MTPDTDKTDSYVFIFVLICSAFIGGYFVGYDHSQITIVAPPVPKETCIAPSKLKRVIHDYRKELK